MKIRFAVHAHLDESFDPETGEHYDATDIFEYGDVSKAEQIIDTWKKRGWTIARTFLADECGQEISDIVEDK